MNPLALLGPDFLAVYLVAALLAIGWMWWRQSLAEAGDPGEDAEAARAVAADPYLLASLRGGPDETLRTALVALIERDLLTVDGQRVHAAVDKAVALARQPLDRAILAATSRHQNPQDLFDDLVIMAEAKAVAAPLREHGLLASPAQRRARMRRALLVAGILAALSASKIVYALAHGHSNVGFLIMLTIAAAVAAIAIAGRAGTSRGARVLAQATGLLAALKFRRIPAAGDPEHGTCAFLAAAFGAQMLPSAFRARLDDLPLSRRSRQSGGDSGGSSCGSSCSAGSSCGGGGGCGGGGCGGCGGG